VVQSSSLRFVRAVQALGAAARAGGLAVPGFRSPPRLRGVQRSIKRWPGGAMVAVVVRDRPWPAVLADLVEGVVAANGLQGPPADAARGVLWAALAADDPVALAPWEVGPWEVEPWVVEPRTIEERPAA
jgi:hypothetical protein